MRHHDLPQRRSRALGRVTCGASVEEHLLSCQPLVGNHVVRPFATEFWWRRGCRFVWFHVLALICRASPRPGPAQPCPGQARPGHL